MPALNRRSAKLINMTKCFEAALACKAAQICFVEAVLELILMHFSKCVKRILRGEVYWYRSCTRPRVNSFTAWHMKTTFVYLARCPRNQFSRAIVIAHHENCRLCSRKTKYQQNLCAFAPLSAEQLWLQLSEHHISFTRWPRTQNLVICLKTQPAFSPCLPAPLPSAALGCDGSLFPTKGGLVQKENSRAKIFRAFACSKINIHDATVCLRAAFWIKFWGYCSPSNNTQKKLFLI